MQSEDQGIAVKKRLKELRKGRRWAKNQAAAMIKVKSAKQRVGQVPARLKGKA
jgi:hypothetical protein